MKIVFNQWLKVFEVEKEINGSTIKREVVSRKKKLETPDLAVGGLLYDYETQKVFLVKQYRPGAMDYVVEIMAGLVDDGETPLQAFKREAMEEVGFDVAYATDLGVYYTSPGSMREQIHLFCGFGSKTKVGGGISSEQEHLEIIELQPRELKDLNINDVKTKLCIMDFF